MQTIRLNIDENLREYFTYSDEAFPFQLWRDDFERFPDKTLACHWHDSVEAGIVTSGAVDYSINGQTRALYEGCFAFVNRNALHMARQRGDAPAKMCVVTFRPSVLSQTGGTVYQKYLLPVLRSELRGLTLAPDSARGAAAAECMREFDSCGADYGFELRCVSILARLWEQISLAVSDESALIHSAGQRDSRSAVMKNMLYFVHSRYKDDISVDELAKSANVSRSECFRCFRRFVESTPVDYINDYRLSQAAMLLRRSQQPVSDISSASGFSSSSYFGKLFRGKYGVSPSDYRRNM